MEINQTEAQRGKKNEIDIKIIEIYGAYCDWSPSRRGERNNRTKEYLKR